jgi:hypothetical protein
MAEWKRRLLGLGLPCLLAFLLDTALRVRAQPARYWAGDYDFILQEGSTFVRRLYTWHPLAAIAGYGLWAALVAGLLLLLPRMLAVILTLIVVFGHLGGVYSWLAGDLGAWWYQLANAMFLVMGIGLGVGVHWYLRSFSLGDAKSGEERGWFAAVRWCCIGVLFGTGYFLFLGP